jgi:hypothetical protein
MSARKYGARHPCGKLIQPKVADPGGAYVYVMEADGQGACKVGVSVNPNKRAVELSCAGLINIRVCWAGRVADRKDAFAVERLAHLMLSRRGWGRANEWFACSGAFAHSEVLRAAEQLKCAIIEDGQYGWLGKTKPVENQPLITCNLARHVA